MADVLPAATRLSLVGIRAPRCHASVSRAQRWQSWSPDVSVRAYAGLVPDWLIWLAFGAVLGVAEILTVTLYLGVVAAAAMTAAIVAGLGAPPILQAAVFAVASGALLVAVHPVAV